LPILQRLEALFGIGDKLPKAALDVRLPGKPQQSAHPDDPVTQPDFIFVGLHVDSFAPTRKLFDASGNGCSR
jgi:hypothetical protein